MEQSSGGLCSRSTSPTEIGRKIALNRSAACVLAASAMGAPAWLIEVKALPNELQIVWLVAIVGVGLLGGVFWARDKE